MRFLLPIFLFFAPYGFSQAQKNVDFVRVQADINPDPYSKEISGTAKYEFNILEKVDTIYLDAVDMVFDEVMLNEKQVKFTTSHNKLSIKAPRRRGRHVLKLKFKNNPSQTVYFVNWNLPDSLLSENEHLKRGYRGIQSSMDRKLPDVINNDNEQIWTQGQGKYTSHWLPSIDDMTDKIEFDLTIRTDKEYKVIANGRLIDEQTKGEVTVRKFDMKRPMSSYLTAFVMGTFDKKVIRSTSNVPIELYYEPQDSFKVEPTYRYTKEIFDFFEKEIGVPYPWQNYKQVPVQDFLYAGMENTTCTLFSNQYVIDSTAFVDKNYVNVNAHELAHQWFGNLVTEASGEHHWLHEGFATYYAYLAEKELFGEDHFYWKLYQTAKTLHNLSENEGGEALTNPNANSLTFYEKGAWALVALRAKLGDTDFREGIQNYLNRYAFKNATISNFLHEMEVASEMDLSIFRSQWLESEEFPWNVVKELLKSQNTSIRLFFELLEDTTGTIAFNEEKLMGFWGKEVPIPFKKALIFKYGGQISDSSLSTMAKNESLKVRQAIAQTLPEVSKELQSMFESMLFDKSYITQEIVLFKLWQAFPTRQKDYLDILDGAMGLPNKNIRLLWLTLALVTQDYQLENKKAFYDELNAYTESHNNFEVRQLAFQYLHQIRALNNRSLQNLIQGANHHVWQFKKSSRNLLRELNGSEEGKGRLVEVRPILSEEQNQLLDIILNP